MAPLERENKDLVREVQSLRTELSTQASYVDSARRQLHAFERAADMHQEELAAQRRAVAELQVLASSTPPSRGAPARR